MRFLRVVMLAALASAACGRAPQAPLPSDPAATVATFLAAVKANDLAAMGAVWGRGDRGPGPRWEDPETLRKRLVVMQSVLVHDRYEMVAGNDPIADPQRPVLRARLFRNGCEPVVPFTMVRYRDGWLIEAVDLAAAGNPVRRCQ
jgi:hypothetical protein